MYEIIAIGATQTTKGSGFLSNVILIGQEWQTEYERHGVEGPKLGFIYCSGTWVHSFTPRAVNDLSVVDLEPSPTPELVAWRVDLEKQILDATDVLDVMIPWPALLYGRELTIWSPFVAPLLNAARGGDTNLIEILLDKDVRPSLVYVDDAARAFQCAIAELPCIFNGWGVTLKGPGGDMFGKAMSTTFRGSSARAEQLLGWRPGRLGGFVKDMDIYAVAFPA
ncbi:hypothetical protein CFD26_100102 [Aspergillus turcosus]|uniref:NAD-dependent epimerase/dehydratase domain-containing protein n=1 Tax=Aspergillus turcosus TaxID=1245748 RepID=A0A3R7G547_9EURO|nr:hypothetical protein CFD26_100102 [Aspergillus turcosus]